MSRYGPYTSQLSLSVDGIIVWTSQPDPSGFGFRLPLFPRLFDALYENREHLPARFWLTPSTDLVDVSIVAQLEEQIAQLLTVRVNVPLSLVLIDDWRMASALSPLGRKAALKLSAAAVSTLRKELVVAGEAAPQPAEGAAIVNIVSIA